VRGVAVEHLLSGVAGGASARLCNLRRSRGALGGLARRGLAVQAHGGEHFSRALQKCAAECARPGYPSPFQSAAFLYSRALLQLRKMQAISRGAPLHAGRVAIASFAVPGKVWTSGLNRHSSHVSHRISVDCLGRRSLSSLTPGDCICASPPELTRKKRLARRRVGQRGTRALSGAGPSSAREECIDVLLGDIDSIESCSAWRWHRR
jgi:hypothetical protein